MRRRVRSKKEVDVLWTKIEKAFTVIYEQRTSTLKYQELFDVFHIITISKFGQCIEKKLRSSFEEVVRGTAGELKLEEEDLVNRFCTAMRKYIHLIDKIKKIAIYYDSRYVLNNEDGVPSALIGYVALRETFRKEGLLERIVDQLIKMVHAMRVGDYLNKLRLREAIHLFVSRF